MPGAITPPPKLRLDRWLWAARFFRTRSGAKGAIEGGKVQVNGAKPKVAKEIMVGEQLTIRRGDEVVTVKVVALDDTRRGAPQAQQLYSETNDSIEARERAKAERKMQRLGLQLPNRKPNKQDRRAISKFKQQSLDEDHDG